MCLSINIHLQKRLNTICMMYNGPLNDHNEKYNALHAHTYTHVPMITKTDVI